MFLFRRERFMFVLIGQLKAKTSGEPCELVGGGYAFAPAGQSLELTGAKPGTQVNFFVKRYVSLSGTPEPAAVVGHEKEVVSQPFLCDEDARLQVLLPDALGFDLAVTIFNYRPGAHLPFVETHIMEHGLLMLEGLGVYRLEKRLVSSGSRRLYLDGALLSAMVCCHGQIPRAISLL
jgi:(S)-ureidoglycine aminohydrolase